MIQVHRCPVCDSVGLRRLKTYTFKRPKKSTGGDSRHREDRARQCLEIFFNEIVQGSDTCDMAVDMCPTCGFVFANPKLTAGDIEAKYRAIEKLEAASPHAPAIRTTERSRRIERLVSSCSGPSVGLRVLDYGGAEGNNLEPFAYRNSCFVVDFIEYQLPEGVGYLGRDLTDLEADERFDLILLCHVLEHAAEPTDLVRSLASLLAPGGFLYVEVPMGVATEWRRIREPLTHFNYFSEQSLARCIRESGLSLLHVSTEYQWVARSRSWCVNVICMKGNHGAPEVASVKSTRRSMLTPGYYLPAVLGYLGRHLRTLRSS